MSKKNEEKYYDFFKVRDVRESEYEGKTNKYLVFEKNEEYEIKLDETFNEKLEVGKEYLFHVLRGEYTDKETKKLNKYYRIIGVKK